MLCFNSKENEDLITYVNKITKNSGVDIVFECAGIPEVIISTMQCLSIKGTLVQVGIGKQNIDVDMKTVFYNEQKIVGLRIYARGDFQKAINFMASKKEKLGDVSTEIIKLQNISEAFKLLEHKEKKPKYSL